MAIRALVSIVFALLSAACSAKAAGAPDIVVDVTACSHCGMLVSEPVYAAAFQAPGKEPRVFDDIGCMLDAARRETATARDIWAGAGGRDGSMRTRRPSSPLRIFRHR